MDSGKSLAASAYPGWDFSFGQGPFTYTPICEMFGTIIRKDDIGEYQGDTQILYLDKDTGKYGYLMFGWGSCSMCDMLQGCRSYDEIDELIESLRSSIRWFDDDADALKFFDTHEWDYDWGHSEEFVSFCRKFFGARLRAAGGKK